MELKELKLKKILEYILFICSASIGIFINKDHSIQFPGYPITMFIWITAGIFLYTIKDQSDEEIKIDKIFLFFQLVATVIINVITSYNSHNPVDFVNIFAIFITSLLLISMYKKFKEPYLELYNHIGKWAIIDFLVGDVVLLVMVLLHYNFVITVVTSLLAWMLMVMITWSLKNKRTIINK